MPKIHLDDPIWQNLRMEETPTEYRPLDVLILAAGLGTRMRSNLAKVLHRADGRPLISHVCRTAASLAPEKIYVVIGHQGDEVREAVLSDLDASQAVFVEQKEQLGTGDAVNAARSFLEERDSTLLILSGDVPMIRAETLGGFGTASPCSSWERRRVHDPFGKIEGSDRLRANHPR